MRIAAWICLVVLAGAIVAALPPPPPAPGEQAPPEEPVVLLIPEDDSYLRTEKVNFSFIVHDAMLNCTLYVDGSRLNNWSSILADETKTLLRRSLSDGRHEWYVACREGDGDEHESDEWDFTVDTAAAAFSVSPSDAVQGSYVDLNGSHYVPGDVHINVSNGTAVVAELTVKAKKDGSFSQAFFMKYTYNPGIYTFTAEADGQTAREADVVLTARLVSLSTDKASYVAGETVKVQGAGFAASSAVTVSILKPGGGSTTVPVRADVNGSFLYPYVLNGERAAGNYSVNASDTQGLSAKASFVIAQAAVDDDYDDDGVKDTLDNCALKANADQKDTDGDGRGDACDPVDPTPEVQDYDGDGVEDSLDNCPAVSNPSQTDQDGDDYGDACDSHDDSEKGSPNIDGPEEQEPSPGSGLPLLVFIILGGLLVIGGAVGYLAYEGKLDFGDLGGSLRALFTPASKAPSGNVRDASDELRHFIFSERSRGYDDIAIRNSLIERGWEEPEVDEMFERIYHE